MQWAHTIVRGANLIATSYVFSVLVLAFGISVGCAEQIPAKHKQGSEHGFLVLKSDAGKVIAVGDLVQVVRGTQVRVRLVFHFLDGSVDDETTVYAQRDVLQLVSDHHVQKGPSFPKPLDLTVNAPSGEVRWLEMKDGKPEFKSEHMDLPDDLANGMTATVLQNIDRHRAETKVSYAAGNAKPRIVHLSIKPIGRDSFTVGGVRQDASRYNIHIELGGVAGAVAPIIGKQPSDIQVWVAGVAVPALVKMEGALYEGGPIWTTELAAPTWPRRAR